MTLFTRPLLSTFLLLTGMVLALNPAVAAPVSPAVPYASQHLMPLAFVPNTGQTDPDVHFEARSQGGTAFFTTNGMTLTLPADDELAAQILHLRFQDANPEPRIAGLEPLPGVVNYFIGSDPTRWRTNLSTYTQVTYERLYPGVDLIYEGQDGLLKGTYWIAPEADPNQIRWRYDRADQVVIDNHSGDLQVLLAGEIRLIEHAPIAWQDINGRRDPVLVAFEMFDDGNIGFAVSAYDRNYPLILDPILEYSTYIGGSERDVALGVEVDDDGFVYVAGLTASNNFPATSGAYSQQLQGQSDAFIMKIDPNAFGAASLIWATYLGGTHPNGGVPNSLGGRDEANAITVDDDGNIYVAGITRSTNFPVTGSAYQGTNPVAPSLWTPTAFLTKLNPDGNSLLYSTYLGGASSDVAFGIAADDADHAYVGGMTQSLGQNGSTPFPTTANGYDPAGTVGSQEKIFVSKFDTTQSGAASLLYSTFLGGTLAGQPAMGMDADNNENVYITGMTRDTDFPVTANAYQQTIKINPDTGNPSEDAFIAQIDTLQSGTDSLVYSTYLGGGKSENWAALLASEGFYPTTLSPDISSLGDGIIYVTGGTMSSDFPIVNGFQTTKGISTSSSVYPPHYDAFVARINTQKSGTASLEYSTFLGGNQFDFGTGIEATRQGNVYVTGSTAAPNFPLRDAIQSRVFGSISAFAVKIDTNLSGDESLAYSTYLGRNSLNYGGLAVDSLGTAFVAGAVYDSSFPIVTGFQPTYGGNTDGFLAKLAFRTDLEVTKTLEPDPAVVDLPMTITINIRNKGPETATAIFLTEVLPDTVLSFVAATPTQGSCAYQTGVLRCDLGYLEDQEIATVVVEVIPTDATLFPPLALDGLVTGQSEDLPTVVATADEVEQELNHDDNVAEETLTIYTFDTFVPVLVAPADNSAVSDTTPTFMWQAVPGAVRYEIQLSRTDVEAAPVITITTNNFTPPNPLLTTDYRWRVRGVANDDTPTAWSEIATVTIAAPGNAAPERGFYETNTPLLTWAHVSWATGYAIEVDNNANFSSPEFADDTLGPDTFSIVTDPLSDGKFYWRVRARRADGSWGSWSSSESFVISLP